MKPSQIHKVEDPVLADGTTNCAAELVPLEVLLTSVGQVGGPGSGRQGLLSRLFNTRLDYRGSCWCRTSARR
jgi:hypothetical protein